MAAFGRELDFKSNAASCLLFKQMSLHFESYLIIKSKNCSLSAHERPFMPLNGIPSAILAKYRKSRGAWGDVTGDNPKIEATPGSLTSQVKRGQPMWNSENKHGGVCGLSLKFSRKSHLIMAQLNL